MVKKVVILGAGISGLSVAWFLKKRFADQIEITLLEKSSRLGGWIHTIEKDGFLFEQGPRSCRSYGSGIETLRLVQELQLEDRLIMADPAASIRYRWINNELCPLPTNLFSFFFSSFGKELISALAKEYFRSPNDCEDETIHSFISRRLNSKIADTLFDPLTAGIYAGDIHRLSMKSCFPLLYKWEKSHGSFVRGFISSRFEQKPVSDYAASISKKGGLFSFKGGMEEIICALGKQVKANILLNTAPKKIDFYPNGFNIEIGDQSFLKADYLVSTLPAYVIGDLLKEHHHQLSQNLCKIPMTSVAVVNLAYRRQVLKKRGFGYLIPSKEGENILGATWDSCVFPQQQKRMNETRITVMIGGEKALHLIDEGEEKLLDLALSALSRHLGIESSPDVVSLKLTSKAIPQYVVGHDNLVRSVEKMTKELSPRLHLCGSSFNGVSVNDCIANARSLACSIEL